MGNKGGKGGGRKGNRGWEQREQRGAGGVEGTGVGTGVGTGGTKGGRGDGVKGNSSNNTWGYKRRIARGHKRRIHRGHKRRTDRTSTPVSSPRTRSILQSFAQHFHVQTNIHVIKITSGRPYLPHPPSSYPIRKAHRVTPGQTIVTPGFKSPRHSGSDASCFEVIANFESCP